MRCIIMLPQLTTVTQVLVSLAAGCRCTGCNRIISFVLIKYKKIFSHAATEKNRQKSVHHARAESVNVLLVQNLLESV